MSIIKFLTVLIFFTAFPSMIIYLLFEGAIKITVLALFLLTQVFIIYYADRFILFLLKATEVLETQNLKFSQILKNVSFAKNIKYPKIYVYSGNKKRSFLLYSRNIYTFLVERKLFESLSGQQLRELYTAHYENQINSSAWLLTKLICMSILSIRFFQLLSSALSFNNKKVKTFFVAISVWLFKPFFDLIYKYSNNKNRLSLLESLTDLDLITSDSSKYFTLRVLDAQMKGDRELILETLNTYKY